MKPCILYSIILAAICVLLAACGTVSSSVSTVIEEGVPAFFVSSSGNDASDGLTEKAAFQTLSRAVSAAKSGDIKRIVIIGALNEKSESSSVYPGDSNSVFFLSNTGRDEILITGKFVPGHKDAAVLSAADKFEADPAEIFPAPSRSGFRQCPLL